MSRRNANVAKNVVYPPGCSGIKQSMQKDEIARRLKDLFLKFQEFDQDESANDVYKPLTAFLATPFFISHTDREVKMFTACILADAMRIFAPNAPFTSSQLKNVLQFFVKQLGELQHPISPIFRHAFYLLDIISSTRVFCAYLDFEDECPSFFAKIFKNLLKVIGKEHASNVKAMVTELCVPLVQEAPIISSEMLDSLFIYIIEPSKSANPVAYKIALDIILKAKDCLEPAMTEFFRHSIVDGSADDSELSQNAYPVLYELCIGVPDVVHTVLSVYLRDALQLPQESLRAAAVRFAGQIFSRASGVGALFASKYPSLWATYLGRSKDASLQIRTNWIKMASQIIGALSLETTSEQEMKDAVFERMIVRTGDVDFQVRLAVIDASSTIAQLDINRVPDALLKKLDSLTRDKHARTRSNAILALGRIYKRVWLTPTDNSNFKSSNENSDADSTDEHTNSLCKLHPEQRERVAWIPNKILHLYAASGSLEDRALVERVLYACLVPVTSLDIRRRLKELILLYSNLDEPAIVCFENLIRYQSQLREVVYRWASSAISDSSSESHGSQTAVLMRMLPSDPCSPDALAHLDRMMYSNRNLAELLKSACDPKCSSTKAADYANEIIKIVSAGSKQKSALLAVSKFILERALPLLLSGPTFVGLLIILLNQTGQETLEEQSTKILPTLRLSLLIASVFKTSCLAIDPVFIGDNRKEPSEQFKVVLDHFVSLFDQLTDPNALALISQILPHVVNSPSAFQNQCKQFHMTVHALQNTLGQLTLRSHIGLAKQATRCLIHLLSSSEYVRVIRPIVDCKVLQVSAAVKKVAALEESVSTSTIEFSPSGDSQASLIAEQNPSVVAYYSLSRIATYLPKSFYNDMRKVATETYTMLNNTISQPASFNTAIRVASLKFLGRWVSSIRNEQAVDINLMRNIAICISKHVQLLYPVKKIDADENKDLVAIGNAALSASFRLLRGNSYVTSMIPAEVVISLAYWMKSIEIRAIRTAMRSVFIKVQRHFIAHTLPPLTLSILACSLLTPDKEARSMMKQMVEKMIAAWRLQVQHQTISSTESDSDNKSSALKRLPDYMLPSAISILSFIGSHDISQLELCRSAISTVFEMLMARPSISSNEFSSKAGVSEEALPLCRGLINKLKNASASISPDYLPPDFAFSWAGTSLVAMINVTLAEIPVEKGLDRNDEAFSVEIESAHFISVMGPLWEIFTSSGASGASRAKPQLPISPGSSPLTESGITNSKTSPNSKSPGNKEPAISHANGGELGQSELTKSRKRKSPSQDEDTDDDTDDDKNEGLAEPSSTSPPRRLRAKKQAIEPTAASLRPLRRRK